MNLGIFDFFRQEKKFSARELREMQEVLAGKNQAKGKGNNMKDFFDNMRAFKEFEREMQEEKSQEINEIIENYVPDDSNKEALKLFSAIAQKFMSTGKPSPEGNFTPNAGEIVEVNTQPPQPEGFLNEKQAEQIAKNMKKQKGLQPFLEEVKTLEAADFEKIKRFL